MSNKRFELSANSYLLFAKLVDYCNNKKQAKINFDALLNKLSEEIKNKVYTETVQYIKNVAVEHQNNAFRNIYNTILKRIINAIIYKKIKLEKIKINQNPSSDLLKNVLKIINEKCSQSNHPTITTQLLFKKLDSFFPVIKAPKSNSVDEDDQIFQLEDFEGTTWYLYYHEYYDQPKTPYTIISRLVLDIKNKDDITLYERKKEDDFRGTASLIPNSNAIVINLTKQQANSPKKLELRIIRTSAVSDESIYFGQYMDTEYGDAIVSGTIILENTKGHQSTQISNGSSKINLEYFSCRKLNEELNLLSDLSVEAIQISLVYTSNWEKFIPDPIAKYLSNKWKNHTKSKPIANSVKDLRRWLIDEKRNKDYEEYKFHTKIDYDLFIVTPVGNIRHIANKKYYQEINKHFFEPFKQSEFSFENNPDIIFNSNKILKKISINKVYYSPRVKLMKKISHSGENSITIIKQDLKAMRRSRFVIFIVPDKLSNTSALIKIGWAIQLEKPIFIFPLKKNLLPLLLQDTYQKKIILSDPIPIKNIPGVLINRADYRDILRY